MAELAALNVKINGDSGGLVAAINSADGALTSFGRVTTAAEANARGFDRALRNTSGGASDLQRQINSLTGVMNNSRRSAESSARVFDRLGDEAAAAGVQMAGAAAQARGVSNNIGAAQGSLGNFAAQFNDIGVMLAAGQSPMQLALQQGTQINQAFAAMGAQGATAAGRIRTLGAAFASVVSPANLVTIGVIAGGAALFQFGMNALGARREVMDYADALEALETVTNDIKRASDIISMSMDELIEQYGQAATRVRELAVAEIELAVARQRDVVAQQIQNDELRNSLGDYGRLTRVVGELGEVYYDTSDAVRAIERDFGELGQLAPQLAFAFNDLRNAATIEDQVAAWDQIRSLLDQAGISLSDLPPELAAALQNVIQLEQGMIDLAAAARQVVVDASGIARALYVPEGRGAPMSAQPELLGAMGGLAVPPGTPPPPPGGGGGMSLADQIERDLERLREGFMTEEEIQLEAYARQQEILQAALEQRLLTQEEYNRLMQQAQQNHQDAMSNIDVYRYGSGLQVAEQFLGDMASALQGGNEQMLRISKAFGAAQALISAWQGAAKALELPFPANLAAFAKVLATGFGAVNAIKGVTAGGGGGGGASVAAGVASAGAGAATAAGGGRSQQVALQLTGGDLFSRDQVLQLINAINESVEDGAIVRLV